MFVNWPAAGESPRAPRWKATVTYRLEQGFVGQEHFLQEISQLDAIIEKGPHWDTILEITVDRINHLYPGLTVEQSVQL